MRALGVAIYAAMFISGLSAARAPAGVYCNVPAQVAACASNLGCECGANTVSGTCEVGNPACVGVDPNCFRFCGASGIVPVCRAGQCVRARSTSCLGDCDANARVDISELVTGVAIALDLEPIAACGGLDRNNDGQVDVAELTAAVRAGLNGCLAERDAASPADALYDAQVTFKSSGPVEALGQLTEDGDRTTVVLRTAPNAAIELAGTTSTDLMLDGSYLFTDVYVSISGTAHVAQDPDAQTVTGAITAQYGYGSEPTGFAMRRSTTLTPVRFAGRYELRFSTSPSGNGGPSHATVTLDVGPHGLGMLSEAADVNDDGMEFGTITTADCQIAPEGHLYCDTQYLIADGETTELRMTGVLLLAADGSVSGGGGFLAGIDPPIGSLYVVGSWSATRVPGSSS